jgi:hypothetical protein
MLKRAKLILSLFLSLALLESAAQELFCNVEVNTEKIQQSDRRIFETLKTSLYEFMNNRSWTGYEYELDERIRCSFLLTIDEKLGDEFRATLTIASQRPVFNSTYNTVLLNTIDKDIEFRYIEYEPLDFNENSYTSNLTSLFAFYAYIIIGLDFDSFTLNGGDQFYQIAQNIVNAAQNSGYEGWKSFEDQRNRYWLVENLTNPAYDPLNRFFYEYHFKGLDMMYEDSDRGRASVLNSLKYLQETRQQRANLYILQLIADAKRDEIINIFSQGSKAEKTEAAIIMKEIDPSHSSQYQKMSQ